MMQIFINEEAVAVSPNTTLKQLLEEKVDDTQGMAVAVNNAVVAKADWSSFLLQENDKVLLIVATQGG